jgi:hypothetical protein
MVDNPELPQLYTRLENLERVCESLQSKLDAAPAKQYTSGEALDLMRHDRTITLRSSNGSLWRIAGNSLQVLDSRNVGGRGGPCWTEPDTLAGFLWLKFEVV